MRLMIFSALSVCLLSGAERTQLFNGKDLTGWRMTGPGRFVVDNGMLKTEGGMGLLWYTGQRFGNQTIHVVFKTASEHANSGVVIRLADPPSDPWYGVNYGNEVQIDAGGDEWHCTGAIYSLSKATKRLQKPQGEWNTLDIELKGQITRIALNGEMINEYDLSKPVPERKAWYEPVRGPRPDLGYIGLQNHDGNSTVYFKEVSVEGGEIRPLKTLEQGDRDRMLAAYHSTKKMVVDTVSGLSQEQWNYKPAPDRWSVAEVVEHLVLTEQMLFNYALSGLGSKAPAPETPMKDEDVVAGYKNRANKVQAPEPLRPSGKWKSGDELISEFKLRRDHSIDYVERTPEALRDSYLKMGPWTVSVYQGMLAVPAHNERHLAQIVEVMSSPGFPKK